MKAKLQLPEEASALLVTHPANVRYLSGFSAPSDGMVLYRPSGSLLFTDSRYNEQAQAESTIEVEIVDPREGYTFLRKHLDVGVLAYEAHGMSCERLRKIASDLKIKLMATTGVVEEARLVKSKEEVQLIAAAARLSDEGFTHILPFIKAGAKELDVALELEFWLRKNGAEAAAFDFIVASGARGSLPHGVASDKAIAAGELVTLDFGAVIKGYHSDMTRTVAVGHAGEEMRRVYDVVARALQTAIEAARPGVSGSELDKAARDVIAEEGYGAYFVHSLGHGVGLEIHERPFLNSRSDTILREGMVITLEPGVYLPHRGGVRIEELALVTERGIELLSHSPKEYLEL